MQKEPQKPIGRLERCCQLQISITDFHVDLGDVQFTMYSKPVLSERHIGIDQGVYNYAIAVLHQYIRVSCHRHMYRQSVVIFNCTKYKVFMRSTT